MRILLGCDAYESAGGIQSMIEALSRAFKRKGHAVFILSTASYNQKVRDTGNEFMILRHQSSKNPWKSRIKNLFRARQNRKTFQGLLKEIDPDVCNLHIGPLIDEAFGLVYGAGVPLVVTLQSFYQEDFFSHRHELNFIRNLIKAADMVTAVSHGVLNSIESYFAGLPTKVVHNGIPICFNGADHYPRKKQGLFVGRLSYEKGCDVLLKAAVRLPSLHILIAGEGPESETLQEFCHSKKLKNVNFIGSIENNQARCLMRESRFLALPSRYEGLPLTVLEAMNEGCPVIASDLLGTREIIDNRINGILVPPEDPDALSNAIEEILNKPAIWKDLQRSARAKVARYFSIENIAEKYIGLYRQLIEKAA